MEVETGDLGIRSKFTIRTSDRRTFRRCKRKWQWLSSLGGNWKHKGTEQNINFWFGSAIHFAMEDFHGWNRFKDPRRAFYAYYKAFPEVELPAGADFHYELGMSMLSYYLTWYQRHNDLAEFETVWFDDQSFEVVPPFTPGSHPAVEQSFMLPLSVWAAYDEESDKIVEAYWHETDLPAPEGEWCVCRGAKCKIIPIMYHGTIDRMVIDKYGRLWLLDYKTAKSADTNKLDTDDQISAYLWAVSKLFNKPFYGFIYLQLTKDKVQEPRRLKNGQLSVDKKQKTTYSLLKQEIIADYGSVREAPDKLIQFLNTMAEAESPEGDKFIRWDFVKRTKEQIDNTEKYIYYELRDMLSSLEFTYPSPTRDCIWDCPIREICLATDKEDNEYIEELMLEWEKRPHSEDGNIEPWRQNIQWPVIEDDLIPLDDILLLDQCMTIELDSQAETGGFNYLYEEEDC